MNSLPLVPDYIAQLLPMVAGKPISEVKRELGLKEIIKLASNENPMGPPSGSVAAIKKAARNMHSYPDPGQFDLRQALAERHDLSRDEIVLGNGTSELIDILIRTFVGPEEHVLTSDATFIAYKMSTESHGREFKTVSLNPSLGHDLETIVDSITPTTKVVFIANPNNPTGTLIGKAELQNFISSMDAKTAGSPPLLVLDEAYYEYIDDSLAPDTLSILRDRPRTVLLRTFSKAYGLAGIRCGYAMTSIEIAGHLNKVRSPFNVNSVAQSAAIAALEDDAYLSKSVAANRKNREKLQDELIKRGFSVADSHANFLLVDLRREAKPVFDKLLEHGIITRPVGVYGLPTSLRISVGTNSQNRRLITALDAIIKPVPQRLKLPQRAYWWQLPQLSWLKRRPTPQPAGTYKLNTILSTWKPRLETPHLSKRRGNSMRMPRMGGQR